MYEDFVYLFFLKRAGTEQKIGLRTPQYIVRLLIANNSSLLRNYIV